SSPASKSASIHIPQPACLGASGPKGTERHLSDYACYQPHDNYPGIPHNLEHPLNQEHPTGTNKPSTVKDYSGAIITLVMALLSGTHLGPYEITATLGAGGMGEVYRARDTKLKREVALKVLPELFTNDRRRLARFEREARVLASLNHPNIASIYGLEEYGG